MKERKKLRELDLREKLLLLSMKKELIKKDSRESRDSN